MCGRAMWITNATCHTPWMNASGIRGIDPVLIGSHVMRIKTRIGSWAAMEQAAPRVENPVSPVRSPYQSMRVAWLFTIANGWSLIEGRIVGQCYQCRHKGAGVPHFCEPIFVMTIYGEN